MENSGETNSWKKNATYQNWHKKEVKILKAYVLSFFF